MGNINTPWQPDDIEAVRVMWFAGKSASVIARKISDDTGHIVSRNAVIGIVHRKGWSGRLKSKLESSSTKATNPPRPVAPVKPVPPKPPRPLIKPPTMALVPIEKHLPLLALRQDDCRYPTRRENDQHLFCAAPVKPGSSYCAYHYGVCHETRAARETKAIKALLGETKGVTERRVHAGGRW